MRIENIEITELMFHEWKENPVTKVLLALEAKQKKDILESITMLRFDSHSPLSVVEQLMCRVGALGVSDSVQMIQYQFEDGKRG